MLYENNNDISAYLSILDNLQSLSFSPADLDSSIGGDDDSLKPAKTAFCGGESNTKYRDDIGPRFNNAVWGNESPHFADLSSTTESTLTTSSRDGSLIRENRDNCRSFNSLNNLGSGLDETTREAAINALNSFDFIFKENNVKHVNNEFAIDFPTHRRRPLVIGDDIAIQQYYNSSSNNLCPSPLLANLSSNNVLVNDRNSSNSFRKSLIDLAVDRKCSSIVIRPWLQFGGFGTTNANFTEPNSVVLSPKEQIIVADTNSHQIKLFDNNGRFLYKFGEAGKSHGKMLYPCKIDLLPAHTESIAIVQRNPMPQIQIFKLNGQYENRFAHTVLKFPRAMCVDEMGSIIVIESKVMTCHIFSPDGRYLRKLHLQNDLNFPFDICAHNGEIFISDNQAHCVKVFDYNGKLLRKIGEGVVKFPVCLEQTLLARNVCLDYCAVKKSIFITDNHERLNVNQFSLTGKLLNSYHSGIKHAQCYDVTTSVDDMILASKDYRIYRYKLPDKSNHVFERPHLQLHNFVQRLQ